SEEHTSELQSLTNLVCRLLLEKKKKSSDVRKLEEYGEQGGVNTPERSSGSAAHTVTLICARLKRMYVPATTDGGDSTATALHLLSTDHHVPLTLARLPTHRLPSRLCSPAFYTRRHPALSPPLPGLVLFYLRPQYYSFLLFFFFKPPPPPRHLLSSPPPPFPD